MPDRVRRGRRPSALGIIAAGEFDLDTVETRLCEECAAANSCSPAPAMIAAFARRRV